ncbi:hypothetical protein Dimus_004722, partial [Dionaea muscipula]
DVSFHGQVFFYGESSLQGESVCEEGQTLGSGEGDISVFGYDLVKGDDGNDRNLRNRESESGEVERQLLNEGEPSTNDGEERNNNQLLPLISDAPAQYTDGRPAPPSDGRPDHIHQPLPEVSTSPDVRHSSIQPLPSDVSNHQSSSVPPPSQPTRLPPRVNRGIPKIRYEPDLKCK